MLTLVLILNSAAVLASAFDDPESNDLLLKEDVVAFTNVLNFAKQQSIRLGKAVTVCAFHKAAPNQCSDIENISGWLVFAESISNNYWVQKLVKRSVLKHDLQVDVEMTLDATAQNRASRRPVVVFQPNGRADRRGTLTFCDSSRSGDSAVGISLSGAGKTETFHAAPCVNPHANT